jgi:hypothetical protein
MLFHAEFHKDSSKNPQKLICFHGQFPCEFKASFFQFLLRVSGLVG